MTPDSAEDPPILKDSFGPVSYEITVFVFLESLCALNLVCTIQMCGFYFFQSYGVPAIKPLAFKTRLSVGSCSHWRIPQSGENNMGFRIFNTVVEMLWYNYFAVLCRPPSRCQILL